MKGVGGYHDWPYYASPTSNLSAFAAPFSVNPYTSSEASSQFMDTAESAETLPPIQFQPYRYDFFSGPVRELDSAAQFSHLGLPSYSARSNLVEAQPYTASSAIHDHSSNSAAPYHWSSGAPSSDWPSLREANRSPELGFSGQSAVSWDQFPEFNSRGKGKQVGVGSNLSVKETNAAGSVGEQRRNQGNQDVKDSSNCEVPQIIDWENYNVPASANHIHNTSNWWGTIKPMPVEFSGTSVMQSPSMSLETHHETPLKVVADSGNNHSLNIGSYYKHSSHVDKPSRVDTVSSMPGTMLVTDLNVQDIIADEHVGHDDFYNTKEASHMPSPGTAGLFNPGPIHMHLRRNEPSSSNKAMISDKNVSRNVADYIFRESHEFQNPHANMDNLRLGLSAIEDVNFVEKSFEGGDRCNPAEDSPCWKGASAARFSHFEPSAALSQEYVHKKESSFGSVIKEPQNYLLDTENNMKKSCGNSNGFQMHTGIVYQDRSSAGSPRRFSVTKFAPEYCKSGSALNDGPFQSKPSCDFGLQQYVDITKMKENTVPPAKPTDCESGSSQMGLQLVDLKEFITQKQQALLCTGDVNSGCNVNNCSEYDSSHTAEHVLPLPSSVLDATTPENSAGKASTEKLDVQMLLDRMQNLSELLLSHCLNDACEWKEQDCNVLKNVISNLNTCALKNEQIAPVQECLFNQPETSKHAGESRKFRQNSCLKRPQLTKIGPESSKIEFENPLVAEANFCFRSGKPHRKLSDSISPRVDTEMTKADNMTKDLKRILSENFHGDDDEGAEPQTVLYKNLWLEAEATLCSVYYRARYNQMKIEMDKHSYKEKVMEKQSKSEVIPTLSQSQSSATKVHYPNPDSSADLKFPVLDVTNLEELSRMIDLLENCVSHYHIFIENELRKDQEQVSDNNFNKTKDNSTSHCSETEKVHKTFLEFVRERFLSVAVQLRDCISVLCTHVARSYILDHNFEDLVCLIHKVSSFEALLFQSNIVSEVLEKLFSPPEHLHNSCESSVGVEYLLYKSRTDCLSSLRTLKGSLDELSLPNSMNKESIREFCLQTSSLIFSTASSSFKLHSVVMEPLKVLVIDEAAQLKECESIIPLLLPNVEHAVLVGDECQLPAMVASNVSHKVGFGRSLFARLSSLGHPNHFLNIQYRMHPAISSFPNSHFYFNQILDAPNVVRKNYRKQYLPGPMFGPYSFINVVGGIEEFDDAGRSRKNMVEVAIVMKIIKNCFKAWCDSKENLSIGVVSPYAAQVVAIQDLLGQRYDTHDGFDVKVKTIDGFQGGERDIIILSTVRTNHSTSLQFISNHQRTNVALTRARYCLWVLGNERTLTNEENVWKSLVLDAKKRRCFFNADEDKELAKSIWDTKKELDQLDDLLNPDSFLFKKSRWKVLFSDNFLKSFKKLRSKQTKKLVLDLLLKLSTGWRPKRMKVDLLCGNSSQILKQFKVESLFVVCSTDIVKESMYTQVLKIWDIMPLEDVPKLVKRLDNIFGSYTDEFISCCSEKCLEGNMVVPISWERSTEITKFKTLDNNGNEAELSGCDQRIYVENSKVEESLLLMKFYSLSSVVISHLLSDRISDEFDLPFEVSDEEYDIILFPKSTFVLGRSGTGKTTVLTVKLFQKEYKHHMAVEETYGINSAAVPCLNHDKEYKKSSTTNDRPVLHQLFVTVSPKLCQAVKHHVVRLKRFVCGGNIAAESNSIEEDIVDVDTSIQFKNTPDSFMNLPIDSYPLVITFQKFLMMLDGTVGISYFERFSDLSSDGKNLSARSVALETFIRKKEVTYGRFDSLYWPHFNYQYTKKLDSSRVFTEIISHIKGGMQAVESSDGKLSREEYLSLSENRASSLIRQKREIIYDIYQSYEKMKNDKGDFDLADIVIDLHRRLRINKYEGDEMHFVYIDEVQDLTMNQIALFKYVCQNVEEGFVFCGDTAQTIARGIDFRFQDIKSLFYKRFVLESKGNTHNQGKVKGKISETFLLSQNFRTHAGVLKLSQSTIELLFRFFPHSIDVLKPETSLIYGEGPVVLECGSRKNAIVTIFGNSGHVAGKIVGFGAEQVILVRDDSARKEVLDYVEKQALVLTILECKGLEFQDVLLYNFFGSSPLKNRWRVIYEYMKEQEMLEPTELKSYPNFSDSKHNLLCSELKQLYVAITRTRQRLWICENTEVYSRPMFDYWRKKGLVQFKELDDSLAQAMKVASSPEEWRSRGKKLYYQNNYEMATMCFERAGDSYWERKSKASGLRANANRLRDLNPEDSNAMLREAAEIFEGIGMAESAAQCFSDLGDYERAGKLYLEKCEEPDLKRAGDCFYLAGCYETAARVYAGGSFFSDCLNVCAKGGLFDIGLYYIQHWEKNENADHCMVDSHELFTIEQKFLENCARNYLDRKDTRSMMKFVKAFHSMDLKREFLRSLSLLDELLVLEEESGNFMEAANIAKMMGDVLHEVDLLGKASKFMEACELMLLYVLGNSLWSAGSKGWPIKPFAQKVELLNRALSFAKEELSSFYVIASTEAEILSNEHSNTFEILNHLKSSRTYGSIRGEIICLWKLLDAHFQLNSSKFVWLDNLLDDSVEGMLLENQFSVESLFHCWTCWKDNIVCVVESLPSLKSQDIHHHSSYGKFALNYLGVRKQTSNLNDIYILLIPEANWVMKLGDRFLKKNGRLVSVDVQDLVSAAESYWSSQLVSVGMKVLHILDALYKFSASKALSEFCQFRSLFLIYDVFKFLLKSKCFNLNHGNLKTLEKFSRTPIDRSLCYLVPLDWSKSLIKDMVYLRTTETCQDLVKDVIYENINRKDMLTYGQIGNVVVMILGTANLKSELFVKILARFKENPLWQEFIQSLHLNSAQKNSHVDEAVENFYKALQYTYSVNWTREIDYISPSCFMYLLDRLLLLTSHGKWKGFIFATKSSFVEWLIHQDENSFPNLSVMADVQSGGEHIHRFIFSVLRELLNDQNGTISWIRKSNLNVKNYFPLFLLRLIVSLCLLHLSSGKYLELLHNLLKKNHVLSQLPLEFRNVLQKGRNHLVLKVFAEAFKLIGNPLVVARFHNTSSEILCPDAVFVDLTICQRKFILEVLFPNRVDSVDEETAAVLEASDSTSKEFSSTNCSSFPNKSSPIVTAQTSDREIIGMSTNADSFWATMNNLWFAIDHKVLHNSTITKELLNIWIDGLSHGMHGSLSENPVNLDDKNEVEEVVNLLDEMKQLFSALATSGDGAIENHAQIGELCKRILSRRPKVGHVMNKLYLLSMENSNVGNESSQAKTAVANDEHGQNALEESKDNLSKNSEGATNSGHGNIKENTKGKKNKKKKGKGGRRGKK